ncbi:serpin family protein [Pseudogracilibacillus sp. SO30301A]|uniref:serpin family protein n=1 Tax=Pseudogracilibacillus sp. SO30301A TaxID=3098291 RepID=UPI00300DD6DD
MSKRLFFYLSFYVITLVAGCGSLTNVDNSSEGKDVDNSNTYETLIWSNNELGFSLLDKVTPDDNNNIFISPTSALFAIGMVYNGAEGDTKDEIAKALGLNEISVDELNQDAASLLDSLDRDMEGVELSIANSIWLNQEFNLKEEFVNNTRDFYQAEISQIDVFDDASVDKINNWVSESTKDKIEEIVEAPLHPDLVTLLINALYFKGKWKHEFDVDRTEAVPFYTEEKEVEVPMMVLDEKLSYMENPSFQAVKLPYGKGEMSMNIFLPRENSSIDTIIKNFTVDNWNNCQTEFQAKNGIIKLPKFQVEFEVILNEPLKQLGMENAFDSKKADFRHIIKENEQLWVDEVKQKTYIDVNEEGTEAAAVTSIAVLRESSIVEDTFYMEVNRPFFIAITDDKTGAILFMGIITNPKTEGGLE